MRVFKLYVDELGMSHPKSYKQSPYFVLVGCIIDEQHQQELENYANHIKFKYWGRTDIILHSADIFRNLGDFSIFESNKDLKREFYKDVFTLLHQAPITITAALIDKQKAFESYWHEKTVISRAASIVLFNFLAFIYTKRPCRGKTIIEASSWFRDQEYLHAFNDLLSPNLFKKDADFPDVREYLTSINFVTKKNHDIESQIADLLAYGIRCRHEVTITKTRMVAAGSYERKMIEIVEHKLMRAASTMGKDKKKYFDKTQPVTVAPKRTTKPKEKRA